MPTPKPKLTHDALQISIRGIVSALKGYPEIVWRSLLIDELNAIEQALKSKGLPNREIEQALRYVRLQAESQLTEQSR